MNDFELSVVGNLIEESTGKTECVIHAKIECSKEFAIGVVVAMFKEDEAIFELFSKAVIFYLQSKNNTENTFSEN